MGKEPGQARRERGPGEEHDRDGLKEADFSSGNVFQPGHHLDLNGPVQEGSETAISAACFARDRALGSLDTPFGRVDFVQLVGITADELLAIKGWNTLGFLKQLEKRSPWLVTDLSRPSLLDDPDARRVIHDRSREEGSSTGGLFGQQLDVKKRGLLKEKVRLVLGALETEELLSVLSGRILHGRPLLLTNGRFQLELVPSERASVHVEGSVLELGLPSSVAQDLLHTLRAQEGEYRVAGLDDLVIEVVKSEIKSSDGSVSKTLG